MDYPQFIQKMTTWYVACQAYDQTQPNRLDRWRNLEPESAQFLMQLLCMLKAKRVLELGTSNGFSTAWLAYALKAQQGALMTVEIDPMRSASAQFSLQQLGIAQHVDFIVSDIQQVLVHAQSSYDMIFLDAERSEYHLYIQDLKRLLRLQQGNTLVVDNVISHAKEVATFLEVFHQDAQFYCQTLAIGAGLFIVTYHQ